MALKSDDSDIRKAWLRTQLGGNGDFYIEVIQENRLGIKQSCSTRISTSGGNAPRPVKEATAKLYSAMEEAGLNEHPYDDEIKDTAKQENPENQMNLLRKQIFHTKHQIKQLQLHSSKLEQEKLDIYLSENHQKTLIEKSFSAINNVIKFPKYSNLFSLVILPNENLRFDKIIYVDSFQLKRRLDNWFEQNNEKEKPSKSAIVYFTENKQIFTIQCSTRKRRYE